ncbi:hypothetical protein [Mesorhizobium sp.]|uniref:hypothetical protein n=1 Tax=Mesorhizobium sp. TaxID=1871066 RepID=UPI000FE760D8|nr:hypothetical protein [Mesorhizobium sp.]RWB26197.1 MAG: hypothetical protein EOQ43_31445 [Mesorhizobium sp.]
MHRLLDGKPVNSCLVIVLQSRGHEITTVEGLMPATGLGGLQQAFLSEGAQPYKRRAIAGLGLDLIARISDMSPRHQLFEQALT